MMALFLIVFLPLLGSLVVGFFGKKLHLMLSHTLSCMMIIIPFFLSLYFLKLTLSDSYNIVVPLFEWLSSGDLITEWSLRLDLLTSVMLVVVTSVSSLVHIYSIGYMSHDPHQTRFFAYLSFFTFAMLMLVTSNNFLQLFFGWEGVGLASYLLIGFWHKKDSANSAAMKAFIVNRVGDFGFLIGLAILFFYTSSLDFDTIFSMNDQLSSNTFSIFGMDFNVLNTVCFFLFMGAMGKSAQLFLHTWLPDAMEGPTPVSALIHAATMVTAGVFLVCRMSPLMEYAPEAMGFVTFLGATTAFFAATVGLVQNDIKRVIAYSTCSQLGYMFVAAGVGVYSVAMFHLFTHAFFKAMLFLGAGSVIHAMHHEQDMRNYGGLRHKIPYTYWAMMIGTLAITGVGIPLTHFGFAGFLSKDAVIESAWAGTAGGYAFWMLVIAALFTSFYSWRLMFLTFYGAPRGDKHTHEHAHESPMVMLIPLGVLGLGAVFSGMIWFNSFFGDHDSVNKLFGIPTHAEAVAEGHGTDTASHGDDHAAIGVAPKGAIFMHPDNHVMDDAHHAPKWVKVSPFIAMVIGFVMALWFYIWNPEMPKKLAETQRPLYLFLLNKWYFDEIYDAIFVKPAMPLGRFLWKRGDTQTIDGSINGIAMGIVPFLTRLAGRAQSGYIFTYAFAMVIGIVVLITWMSFSGGAH